MGRGAGGRPYGSQGDSDLGLELALQHFVLEKLSFTVYITVRVRRKVQSTLWGLCSWYKLHSGVDERQMLLSDWGGDHSLT